MCEYTFAENLILDNDSNHNGNKSNQVDDIIIELTVFFFLNLNANKSGSTANSSIHSFQIISKNHEKQNIKIMYKKMPCRIFAIIH